MPSKRIILAVLAAVMATSARAAQLSDIQGAVFVNNRPVSAGTEVVQGDRIKVADGSATLVYGNGTAIPIAPGQTVVVLANSPEQVSMKDGGLPLADGALPLVDGPGAALAVAGGVGLAAVLSQTGKPASP